MGAVVSGEYDNIIVVTPSQYGKSWLSSRIAVWLADHNRRCYVAGGKKIPLILSCNMLQIHYRLLMNQLQENY